MLELGTRVAIATWTARIMPVVLISMAAYISYVVVGLLSVNYLIIRRNDNATAISILLTYCLILIILIASFLRLTYTTYCDPPYVPFGKGHAHEQDSIGVRGSYSDKDKFIPSELESFCEKSIFISDEIGRPYWCSSCANWKPDRAHHCSQTGRCIRKMDHFCPWVGGPVGESNFKFFIQFTSYGALYCTYVLVVVAIITSIKQRMDDDKIETPFMITIGVASTFLLFSGAMSLHGIRLAITNTTQVERIGKKKKVYNLAVFVPPKENSTGVNNLHQSLGNQSFITYPLEHNIENLTLPTRALRSSILQEAPQPHQSQSNGVASFHLNVVPHSLQPGSLKNDALEESLVRQKLLKSGSQDSSVTMTGAQENEVSNLSKGTLNIFEKSNGLDNTHSRRQTSASQETLAYNSFNQKLYRSFVVLRTNEGDNPWDLGSCLQNWQTVMGNSMLDWFLPIRRSPCCNHDSPQGHFQFGLAVDDLLSRFGLAASDST